MTGGLLFGVPAPKRMPPVKIPTLLLASRKLNRRRWGSPAEKVSNLVAGLLRIVNGDLGRFLRSFRNVFARVLRGVVG
jgi:hypothetical protein